MDNYTLQLTDQQLELLVTVLSELSSTDPEIKALLSAITRQTGVETGGAHVS